jgi:hypothetical protein
LKKIKREISPYRLGEVPLWTNTFSRSTVHWDNGKELLDQEMKRGKAYNYTDKCCGNSPGKSHTFVHDGDCTG